MCDVILMIKRSSNFRWNKAYQSHLHKTYTISSLCMFCDFSFYFWCFRSTHSSFGPASRSFHLGTGSPIWLTDLAGDREEKSNSYNYVHEPSKLINISIFEVFGVL